VGIGSCANFATERRLFCDAHFCAFLRISCAFPKHYQRIICAVSAFYRMQPNAGCILGRVGVFATRIHGAFSSICCAYTTHCLRILHSVHRIWLSQGAPHCVHSCAFVRILSNDVHPSPGGGWLWLRIHGGQALACTECAFSRDEEEC